MRAIRFNAPILPGHKTAAVEVPFDPGTQWQTSPQQLRPGRRGHPSHATLNDTKFDSAIVARSRRFWLLIDDAVLAAAKVKVGEIVQVTVAPLE